MNYHHRTEGKNMESYAYDTVADSLDEQMDDLSADDLLRLAVACIDAALDGRSVAMASLRLQLTTPNPDLYLVALELRSASEAIR